MARRRSGFFSNSSRSTRKRRNNLPAHWQLEVDVSIRRDILAIIYLALAALTVLSIAGQLGIVGVLWQQILRPVFGWGLYVVPVLLTFVALSLLIMRRVVFSFTKSFGLVLFLVSLLGTMHLSVPPDDLYTVAKAGEYGGYIGFVAAFFGRSVLGITGSYVVFFALFAISVLLTFEVSLGEIGAAIRSVFSLFSSTAQKTKNAVQRVLPDDDEEEPELNIIRPHVVQTDQGTDEEESIEVAPAEVGAYVSEEEQMMDVTAKDDEKIEVVLDHSTPVQETQHVLAETPLEPWEFPSFDLLSNVTANIALNERFLKENADMIRRKLEQFDVTVTMQDVHVGPTVVQYTLKPHEGVKLSKITSLKSDLALALAAHAIRIEAPIPGKSLVGIEIPNDTRAVVHLREVMETPEYKEVASSLKLPLGRDVAGNPMVVDLAAMPHLLIAGATGSGKSVGLNSFLVSLLYNNAPHELKMILIDPKRVELHSYNHIPHLLAPVIMEPDKAVTALRWAVAEMNARYQICADAGYRNITEYNADASIKNKMAKIIIVIDELADLMMASEKEVEASICRLAQMARAVGMHLIIATQRPSVDVITGLIKANIPARIAFTVSSSIDSRTILDATGAEDLLGQGDMLYLSGTMNKPVRIQGIYVSSKEIERVTNWLKLHSGPQYLDDVTSPKTANLKVQGVPDGEGTSDDDLYQQAVDMVRRTRKASASHIQRHLRVGYARAAHLVDLMEANGLVGPANGAKARQVFLDKVAE